MSAVTNSSVGNAGLRVTCNCLLLSDLRVTAPRFRQRTKGRRIRFHDLRHTYTSLLIAHSAHPKYIQVQLGHASIQTTLDRYGHLMPQLHQAEAQKLDQLVFPDQQAASPARRLQAVRVGRPARGSKTGAVVVAAGRRGSKMGAENTKGLATDR